MKNERKRVFSSSLRLVKNILLEGKVGKMYNDLPLEGKVGKMHNNLPFKINFV